MKKLLLSSICLFFTIFNNAQNTLIPDSNFEQALIDLSIDSDGVINGQVLTSDIDTLIDLDVFDKGISDLTGIEDFAALENLYCNFNTLTSLDLTSNSALRVLRCGNNQLTSIDVSGNPDLQTLFCGENQLTNLDVSQNTLLTNLFCYNNLLTNLDVTQNSFLISLRCENNFLTNLDFSQTFNLQSLLCYNNDITNLNLELQPNLASLLCQDNDLNTLRVDNGNNLNMTLFNATNNPNLLCIQVDDAAYSSANWTLIDIQSFFLENCNYNSTYIPDNNFELALINLGYDTAPLDNYVTTANIENVTTLDISGNNIFDLTGIEGFSSLSTLFCQNNILQTVDLSQNTALTQLRCQNNNLLFLDLSNNTALTGLRCDNNSLYNLEVNNGNNTNVTFFNAVNNPNLNCISVDDVAYSTTNWTNIDVQSSFSLSCDSAIIYVPDDSFETQLISLGYDSGFLDNYVPKANISSVTFLGLDNLGISDLTGITGFESLTDLSCNNNNISNLDLSETNTIQTINAFGNGMNSIDISGCIDLTNLNLNSNNLANLNTSQNVNLETLNCNSNALTSLILNQNSLLVELQCQDNQLGALNLLGNPNLEILLCNANNLLGLNLSLNPMLVFFNGDDNLLEDLDISNGNNSAITTPNFSTLNNPSLMCITVDDAVYATTNWTNRDAQTVFSEDCSTLSVETFDPNDFLIYPNPTDSRVTISVSYDAEYTFINLNGQVLKNGFFTNGINNLNLESLASGIYFLRVKTKNGLAVKKLIVN
ncbi:T9SS type A sorting domain-containing protein [Psychroserpens luteolus]|uniref:T9SS type A sorting domain-containing protein n=1 Tax=Psychroserpens luteolus TaxID=2855840 RepID=UPI001E4B6936|nr:T9SS type A sorting domain-containing protein [Psychroserpens luteolus]MCD2258827.1 leucine-rich repeat domain-containing protein [Psychroserpens luteolus]